MTTTAAIIFKMAENVTNESFDKVGFIIYGGPTINEAATGAFRDYVRDWDGATIPNRFFLVASDGFGFYDIDENGVPTPVV